MEQHDALLETAERLEVAYEVDREHLGILRNLVTAYSRLLAFEFRSPLGANLCVLASRRLAEFETMAAPWEPADARWIREIRGWLHFQMHQYPQAAATDDPVTRSALRAIRQGGFLALAPHREGRFLIQPYRTLDVSLQPTSPREVLHYLVTCDGDESPDAVRTFCLVGHGGVAADRWYLYSHFLNRATLVRIYGENRPNEDTVLSDVRGQLAEDLEPQPQADPSGARRP